MNLADLYHVYDPCLCCDRCHDVPCPGALGGGRCEALPCTGGHDSSQLSRTAARARLLGALRETEQQAQRLRDELAQLGVAFVRRAGRSGRVDWLRLVEMYPGRTAHQVADLAGVDYQTQAAQPLGMAHRRGYLERRGSQPYRYYPVDVCVARGVES